MNLHIDTLTPRDLPELALLQKKYLSTCPDALMPPVEVYLSPGFADGQNAFCAHDGAGALVGFAPLFPNLVKQGQHSLWVDILVDPTLPDPDTVRDALLERLYARAGEILAGAPALPAQFIFQYLPAETGRLDYVHKCGFTHAASVYTMGRDLSQPIPPITIPEGIAIRPWRMESMAEQEQYVAARNRCFPEARWPWGTGSTLCNRPCGRWGPALQPLRGRHWSAA